jgi:magnesium-transporting ATPase (P-type)
VALFVCLAPTTIGGLLSAIGIAGMDRLVQRNVLAMSGRAVEAAGDCSTLLLDKTGTITYGNRMADEILPVSGVDEGNFGRGRTACQPGRRDALKAAPSSSSSEPGTGFAARSALPGSELIHSPLRLA